MRLFVLLLKPIALAASRTAKLLALACALAVVSSAAVDCRAAEPANPSFLAYRLQHAQAVDIERTLTPLLAREPGARVIVDEGANQLLVTGSTGAHKIARQLISRLDRPAAVAANRPAAAPMEQPASRFATEAVTVEHAPVAGTASAQASASSLAVRDAASAMGFRSRSNKRTYSHRSAWFPPANPTMAQP